MTAGLRDRMRLRHSLALALEVQQSLLPPDAPDIEGLDITDHSAYCDETRGDYYDFLDIAGISETTAAILSKLSIPYMKNAVCILIRTDSGRIGLDENRVPS